MSWHYLGLYDLETFEAFIASAHVLPSHINPHNS